MNYETSLRETQTIFKEMQSLCYFERERRFKEIGGENMSLGKTKPCKYNCGTLLAWDDEEKHFVEPEFNNNPHTRERCESLRGNTSPQKSYQSVKQAVNEDIQFAMVQELREHTRLLKKIAGEE